MKGNPDLIAALNGQLADELTAINQYVVHAEMCDNWGYGKLHDHFENRAKDEMKHVGMLISRILFLEGQPIVSEMNKIHIGNDVTKMFKNDHEHEKNTIATGTGTAGGSFTAGISGRTMAAGDAGKGGAASTWCLTKTGARSKVKNNRATH